jgi:hypothetical protein
MISSRIDWLIAIAVGLPLLSGGSLVFTIEPSSVVYIPPKDYPGKYVVCGTNEPATIIWRFSTDPRDELTPTIYNITALSSNSSGLFLTHGLLLSSGVSIRFLTGDIHCEVGNVTSCSFHFMQGGIYCKMCLCSYNTQYFVWTEESWTK